MSPRSAIKIRLYHYYDDSLHKERKKIVMLIFFHKTRHLTLTGSRNRVESDIYARFIVSNMLLTVHKHRHSRLFKKIKVISRGFKRLKKEVKVPI